MFAVWGPVEVRCVCPAQLILPGILLPFSSLDSGSSGRISFFSEYKEEQHSVFFKLIKLPFSLQKMAPSLNDRIPRRV